MLLNQDTVYKSDSGMLLTTTRKYKPRQGMGLTSSNVKAEHFCPKIILKTESDFLIMEGHYICEMKR